LKKSKNKPKKSKRKKKPKQRTDNKLQNAIIQGMRLAFSRYSIKYLSVVQKQRVELPILKKDGAVSKKKEVWHECVLCHKLQKRLQVDHINPVIELGKTRKDYTLDEYFKRLDCDESNLQAICKECHAAKTLQENKERRSHGE